MKKLLIAMLAAAGMFSAFAGDCCDKGCGGEKAPWQKTFDKATGLKDDTGIAGFLKKTAPAYITGDYAEAERELDLCPADTRNAEWHFLKSVCLDRRGQTGDAMQELNTACTMDPGNEEYAKSRDIYRARAGGYGASYRTDTYGAQRDSTGSFCNCCTNLIVADCCCECLGGDLIPCI